MKRTFNIAFSDRDNHISLGREFEARTWFGAMWWFFWTLRLMYKMKKEFDRDRNAL